MTILSFLFIMLGIFTFTLGVHLGKRVGTKTTASVKPNSSVRTLSDATPSRQEISDRGKGNKKTMEESLSQELHDEVTKTGIKLRTLQTVDLPEGTQNANAGATTLTGYRELSSNTPSKSEDGSIHFHHDKYTLQIATFETFEEGKEHLSSKPELANMDPKPFLREIDLKEQGTSYRIYLGGFLTREEAQQAGKKYTSDHVIDSFVVTELPD